MANATLLKLRKIGAGIPDYSEGNHFGSIALKSAKKMIATYEEDGDEVVVRLEPEHFDALTAKDKRFSKYPRAPHCVIFKGADVSDKELKALVMESYALAGAKQKAPAKKRPARKTSATAKGRAAR